MASTITIIEIFLIARYTRLLCVFATILTITVGQPTKCEQKSPKVKVDTPQEQDNLFELSIESNNQAINQENRQYLPDQIYLVKLKAKDPLHSFKWFMITAEDPDVDSVIVHDTEPVDVGRLKLLSDQSKYSERCSNSIEETDNSDKYEIDVHWLSPKQSNKRSVRIRSMVAENEEVWYEGGTLTIDIEKNIQKPPDSPPYEPIPKCYLCSEARYEIVFQGQWSRLTHPRHYPTKPYETGYSAMLGASHDYDFELWKPDTEARPDLKLLAETGNITKIQKYILENISEDRGVRTLIKGKGHSHPLMSTPSYALFRVDSIHHLFSIVVALRPSPDWFIGTHMFELCTENGWLEESEIHLYPWDAGTANGVSYESETSVTQPVDHIGRVQVGSLDPASPFYQVNLIDLKPFATLRVRRLDVYPITDEDCPTQEEEVTFKENGVSRYRISADTIGDDWSDQPSTVRGGAGRGLTSALALVSLCLLLS